MCGLAGFYNYRESSRLLPSKRELDLMTASLVHRGPDDSGVLYEANIGLGLGHRRLSIRDLSPLGAQPMRSNCGRFWIAYNSEGMVQDGCMFKAWKCTNDVRSINPRLGRGQVTSADRPIPGLEMDR